MNRLTRSAMLFTSLSVVYALICAAGLSGANTPERQRRPAAHEEPERLRQEIPVQLQQRARKEHHPENDAGEGREDAAQNFERQTNSMYEAFKKSTKAEPYLQNCLDTARQIDKIMTSTPLDPAANTQWSTVKTELNTLANAFNVPGV